MTLFDKTPAHEELARLAGEWTGTVRTWFEPGKLGDEQPIHGTMRPLLGGRFVLHEYETMLLGEACQGLALYGFDEQTDRYQSAWIDNCHNGTAIMFSQGERSDSFAVLGQYHVPEHPNWGWRTKIELDGDDRVTITAYNISPEGAEAVAVETEYARAQEPANPDERA